jgi:Ca-activated chloride channel homolog
MVDLFASVYDNHGKLVKGLGRDDFVIYDDGIPQAISQFSREYAPLSVLILLDSSGSMAGPKLEDAKRSLLQFLKRLNPGDEILLMTFQARPRITQTFTQDHEKIKNALRRVESNGSTALYDAVLQSLDVIRDSHNPRRTLLLISDGLNTFGRSALADTENALKRSGVELYAIGIDSEAPEEFSEQAMTRAVLNQLTGAAGGQAFLLTDSNDLGRVCRSISDQMHNQYSLGYYPPRTKDGQWRNIRVVTKVPGMKVVPSKNGYYPAPK